LGFANVYLHELDHYVKQQLKAKYYARYVDDFVILDRSRSKLEKYKTHIVSFLATRLALQLHPQKSRIINLERGTDFLGMRHFPHHKLIKKKNVRKFRTKLSLLSLRFKQGELLYDNLYDFMEGWVAYAKNADTYRLRQGILTVFEQNYRQEMATKEINRGKNFLMPAL